MEALQHRFVSRWLSAEARAVCEAGVLSDGCDCRGGELAQALLAAFKGPPRKEDSAVLTRAFAAAGVDPRLDEGTTDPIEQQSLVTGWERLALCWEGKGFGPPWRPEMINASSIEWMLRNQGTLQDPAVHVTRVDVHRIGVGVGLLSFMMRVTITYNSAGESHKPALPRRVLAKLTPTDGGPAMRARMKMSRYIRTEHDFYATMTRGIADAVGGICACYFTSYDAPTDRSVLLLEDLKARPGEYECDQIKGCSGTEAEVAVAALAKLHAYFYNRAHSMAPFARSLVGSIPTTDEGLVGFNFSLKQLRDGLPHFRDKAAGLGYGPESKSVRAVERLMSGSNLLNLYIDMTPRDEGGQSDGTLMWGDARADNVIFFRGDHGRLSCVLIDWQLARTGPGECDLAQFLSGSLRREHRREFTVPLLRVYHAELTRALVARGVATPPFESVLCGFQRGLLFLARVLPLMGSDAMHDTSKSERANALIESIFCGVMDALAAWDADDWLAAFEQRNMGGAKPSTLDDDIRLLPSWVRTAASAATPSPRKSML